MLKILCPKKFENEKRYVFDVVFYHFLELNDIYIEFSNSINNNEIIIINESSVTSKKIIIYNGLFNIDENDWMNIKSLPILPITFTNLEVLNDKFLYNNTPVLYGRNENKIIYQAGTTFYCDVDIFGGIFFFLTLYEEVVIKKYDEHERFNYLDSIIYKSKLYKRPVVNEYLDILISLLKKINFDCKIKNKKYHLILSHDIDVPFSYNAKIYNFLRNIFADILLRKTLLVPLKKIFSRLIPIKYLKYKLDPYNNFDYIMNTSDRFGIKSTFNFIAIYGNDGIDGRYDIEDIYFRKIFKLIKSRGHHIGLHPSYNSIDNNLLLNSQVDKFKKVTDYNKDIDVQLSSRQHYLRWRNPTTWQLYEDCGINQDSSIGSEYFNGFKCGTCYEYPVYNLFTRKQLKLTELPLLVMDVCVFKFMPFNIVLNDIISINNICKYYSGNMTLLYHNNYIVTKKQKRNYENLLSILLSN
jgi:peptidoglycan/xylan/chitin deacetylase (PgdA/CDA1 family)